MKKVNELNINITKAVISSITVELGDDGVVWRVNGKLLTKDGKEISTFNFSTDSYCDSRKIEVPISANVWARNMFEELTPVIYRKINGEFKSLSKGGKNVDA